MTDADFDAYMLEVYGTTEKKRAGIKVNANSKRSNLGLRDATALPLKQGESFSQGHSIIDGNPVQNRNKIYNN